MKVYKEEGLKCDFPLPSKKKDGPLLPVAPVPRNFPGALSKFVNLQNSSIVI